MKKGQMSAFMILAVVIIVVVVFVFSIVAMAKRAALKGQANEVLDRLFDQTALQQYIDSCLTQVAKDSLVEILGSGGFYSYVAKPGTSVNINENISFLDYYDDIMERHFNVSYLLYRGVDDYAPFYPCPLFGSECGGPGNRTRGTNLFCRYSFTDFPYLSTCTYGDMAPLYLELAPQSIEHQLEYKISSQITSCVNLDFFENELGYHVGNISDGDVTTDVSFSNNDVQFTLNFPVVISLSNVNSVRVSNSGYKLETDIKKLFDRVFFGINNVLRSETSTLNASLESFIENRLILNNLDYDVEVHRNERLYDDVYILKSNRYDYDGIPQRFIFAVGNRVPVLDLIDYAPENNSCEVLVPSGTIVEITPKALDPDDEDNLSFSFSAPGWNRNGNTITKRLGDDDNGKKIKVTVTDGQFNDSQEVNICVDNDVALDVKPVVDFYYTYENIEETYFDADTNKNYQRITLEDPITLSLPPGIAMEGYFTLGECTIPMPTDGANCVVFPTGARCDAPFEYGISAIGSVFDDCDLSVGELNTITFYNTDNDELGSTEVYVDQCVPHVDLSGSSTESPYLETHFCCANDYTYKGDTAVASPQTRYFCGKYPDDTLGEPTANDIFQKTTAQSCLADRGNTFDYTSSGSEIWSNDGNPLQACSDEPAYGVDARCLGCGEYGTFADDLICDAYDYDDNDVGLATFEQAYNPTIYSSSYCNDEWICTTAPGRGKYKPELNDSSLNVMQCQAGCNGGSGKCDYAVNCVCSVTCNGAVSLACHNQAPGTETGTCSEGISPAIPDVCTNNCKVGDASDGRFKCEASGDCSACDIECDGAKAFEPLNSCSGGENTAARDWCNPQGRAIDYVDPVTNTKVCYYDPAAGCDAGVPACSEQPIGVAITGLYSFGDPLLLDMCDDSCTISDSTVCKDTDDVYSLCRGKEIGVAFDMSGNSNPDTVCYSCSKDPVLITTCNDYAWNAAEERCYNENDDIPAEIKCNKPSCR